MRFSSHIEKDVEIQAAIKAPVRFELTTPALREQCSNHWAMKPLFWQSFAIQIICSSIFPPTSGWCRFYNLIHKQLQVWNYADCGYTDLWRNGSASDSSQIRRLRAPALQEQRSIHWAMEALVQQFFAIQIICRSIFPSSTSGWCLFYNLFHKQLREWN